MRIYNLIMNELRKRRKELGITQAQAAHACGVSRRTYQTYEETDIRNNTFDELMRKLDEMGIVDGSNYILNLKYIKFVCKQILVKYPEVKCAYLFGSYSRGEATGKSDVDIMLVCPPMGLKLGGIGPELEDLLRKKVDIHTHRQLLNNEAMLENILEEGIKVYERRATFTKN